VEATSRRWSRVKVLSTIISALEQRLGDQAPPREVSEAAAAQDEDLRTAMDTLDESAEAHDA
jgi:hypothetical protein